MRPSKANNLFHFFALRCQKPCEKKVEIKFGFFDRASDGEEVFMTLKCGKSINSIKDLEKAAIEFLKSESARTKLR